MTKGKGSTKKWQKKRMRTMTKGSYASGLNVGAKMRGKMIIVEANNTRMGDELYF